MNNQNHSVVAGGGLVGSLLSIYLANRGHKISLYEKRSDIRLESEDAGKSINLIVTSRGVFALKNAGGTLFDEVMAITVPVYGRMIHSVSEETTYQPYGKDKSEFNYSISRKELNKILLSYAERKGVEILFEYEVETLDINSKKIRFKNSKEISYNQVYGTDGAGSVIRKEMMESLGERGNSHVDYLTSDYKELFMPAKSCGGYAMEKNALHIWPRGEHMLMALPNNDGSFTMTLYLPKTGSEASFEALKSTEDIYKFFMKEYPDAANSMPDFVEDFVSNSQGILGTVRSNPWSHGDNMVLLGDAAHAVVPFFGQGMNCGFEDITVLDNFLELENENFGLAFTAYDESQRINGNAIADMALENFVEMRDSVADEKFLLKKSVEHKLENLFPDIYRSRYGLVTYSLLPYNDAKEIGILQQIILKDLCLNLTSIEDLDLEKAEGLIHELIVPYLESKHIDLKQVFEY